MLHHKEKEGNHLIVFPHLSFNYQEKLIDGTESIFWPNKDLTYSLNNRVPLLNIFSSLYVTKLSTCVTVGVNKTCARSKITISGVPKSRCYIQAAT